MRDRHTREEADAKRLIKKGLAPEPYLYEIPEPGERYIPTITRSCAGSLKKVKSANKAKHNGVSGDDKADDGADEDDLDEDEEDEDEIDEDEVSKIRDNLAQKSAEKWVRGYIKELHTGPKKDHAIISHLWKEANTYAKNLFNSTYADKIVKYSGNDVYWSSYLNALDKQEESIRLKLTALLAEISKIDVGCRDRMYKLVTKPGKRKSKAMTLEKYILAYIQENECALLADLRSTWFKVVGLEITRYRTLSKLQDDKKDDSSEADIDDIIELYG
ncbi:unnamed protein product [Rhizophagus irregularis]|nr:unnamed protein product [Rhizophagus irregularis]